MDHYVTGAAIRELREKRGMTQADLARELCVSDKAVSKWENGRGFPDISLLEPLARSLHVSVPELLSAQEPAVYVPRVRQRGLFQGGRNDFLLRYPAACPGGRGAG